MSPNPTQPVKKAAKKTTGSTTAAASTVKPSRLTKRMVKALPLSWGHRIKLFLARLWAKLKTWRLRRRVRNV
ncbi:MULTISPECIES: hypothetical protein [unclassified Kribbella]|uniref:hypothetical protein n=1 Tax=unclassified Kribbella TaxID=2644121 RepID=UPI0033D6B335